MVRIVLIFNFFTFSFYLYSENWTQFRGPSGQGHAINGNGLPTKWNRDEGVKWKLEIEGLAWSSPICVNGEIFLSNATLNNGHLKLAMISIDFKSGRVKWSKNLFSYENQPRIHRKNSYASPTPFYDNQRIYVHYGNMGTACVDLNGSVLWKQKLEYSPVHGSGASPVVHEDLLLLSADGALNPSLYALDKRDGSVKWNSIRDSNAKKKFSFCTPIVIQNAGEARIISPASDYVFAYDKSGRQVWKFNYPDGYSVVPRPVYSTGIVYVSSGYDSPTLYAIRSGGLGDITAKNLVWKTKKAVPRNSSIVVFNDLLFMAADNGVVSCLDAKDGHQYWIERVGNSCSSSLLVADQKIFLCDETGKTYIFQAKKEYKLLATNDLKERMLASPVPYMNSLLLRTEKGLWRISN